MRHIIVKISALFLVFLFVVFSFSACGTHGGTVGRIPSVFSGTESKDTEKRSASLSQYKKMFSDEKLTLFFDDDTGSIAVFNRTVGTWRTALPQFRNSTARVMSVTLFGDNGAQTLDSQSDCAANGGISYEKGDGTLNVKYKFSSSVNGTAVISVKYTLDSGTLYVETDTSDAELPDGTVIGSIELMPYFGALNYAYEQTLTQPKEETTVPETETEVTGEAEESTSEPETAAASKTIYDEFAEYFSDYLFLPDGPGAVLYTKIDDGEHPELSFSVYGEEGTDKYSARIGAFGIRSSDSSFAALITSGEAVTEIKAFSASEDTSMSYLAYPVFNVTSSSVDGDGILCGASFGGKLSVAYKFLSGTSSDVMGMAAAVRSLMIRNGFLSEGRVTAGLPVNIEIMGSADGSGKTLVSDYEAVEDFVSVLKGKGLNNVNLILSGYLDGGFAQKSISRAELSGAAGSMNEFESLLGYSGKQGYRLYLDAAVQTAPSPGKAAHDLNGDKYSKQLKYPFALSDGYTVYRISQSEIKDNAISFINRIRKTGANGFRLNDINGFLSADSSGEGFDRQSAADVLKETASIFGKTGLLAVKDANAYSLKYAGLITDIPYYTSAGVSSAYRAEPFMQAVLHSLVCYSGQAANTTQQPKLEMLKAVEYGGVPYYCWTLGGDSQYYYENSFSEAVDDCAAYEKLADLTDKRITAHYEVSDGVFCTEYSSGTAVYVNYNNFSVNVGDIAVMPYDFIRIN